MSCVVVYVSILNSDQKKEITLIFVVFLYYFLIPLKEVLGLFRLYAVNSKKGLIIQLEVGILRLSDFFSGQIFKQYLAGGTGFKRGLWVDWALQIPTLLLFCLHTTQCSIFTKIWQVHEFIFSYPQNVVFSKKINVELITNEILLEFKKIIFISLCTILSWISISVLSFCLNDWLLYAGWNKASKRWQLLQTKNEQKQKFSTFLMNDHLQMNFFLQPKSLKKWFRLMFSR